MHDLKVEMLRMTIDKYLQKREFLQLPQGFSLVSVFASAAFLKVDSHPVPIYPNMANKYVKRDYNCYVLTVNLNNVNMVI